LKYFLDKLRNRFEAQTKRSKGKRELVAKNNRFIWSLLIFLQNKFSFLITKLVEALLKTRKNISLHDILTEY